MGQYGSSGNIINFPQKLEKFVTQLPHALKDLSDILLIQKGGDDEISYFILNKFRVVNDLNWLKLNNPFYQNIKIDMTVLDHLPVESNVQKYLNQFNDLNKDDDHKFEEENDILKKNKNHQLRKNQNEQLTQEVNDKIDSISSIEENDCIIVEKFNISITRNDLECLNLNSNDDHWLNDQIINFYFEMIKERDLNNIYCFNTHFIIELSSSSTISRWTRNVDLFSKRLILIPININNLHWTLVSVDIHQNSINYYDSLNGKNQHCLESIFQFLSNDHYQKKYIHI